MKTIQNCYIEAFGILHGAFRLSKRIILFVLFYWVSSTSNSFGQDSIQFANSPFPNYSKLDDSDIEAYFEAMTIQKNNYFMEAIDELTENLDGSIAEKRDLFIRKYLLGFKPRKKKEIFYKAGIYTPLTIFQLKTDMNFLRFSLILKFVLEKIECCEYFMEKYGYLYLIPDKYDGLNAFEWMQKQAIEGGASYPALASFVGSCMDFSEKSKIRFRIQMSSPSELQKLNLDNLYSQINGIAPDWLTTVGPYTPGVADNPCAQPGSTMNDATTEIKLTVENSLLKIYETEKFWYCPDSETPFQKEFKDAFFGGSAKYRTYTGPASSITFNGYNLAELYAVFVGREGVTLFVKGDAGVKAGASDFNRSKYRNTIGLDERFGKRYFTINLGNAGKNQLLYKLLSDVAQLNYFSGRTNRFLNNSKIVAK